MITQAGISCKWANDSQRFLLEHFDIIKNSPSHIYHSALSFCPSSSFLYKCYSAELSQEVEVVKGVPAEWGKCSRMVTLDSKIICLSCWNNTIAVGSEGGDIIILDAITGSQTATFSGHTDVVTCLVFSPDGRSLVSGSRDKAVKLWDLQTGAVVKTFSGHTRWVYSVSISADCTTIASGSDDRSIRLWSIHTGKCYCTINQGGTAEHVKFPPTDSQHLFSVHNNKIWQWDINGHKAGPTYDGRSIDFSPDGTLFVVRNWESIAIQDSSSGVTVAKIHTTSGADPQNCCFSPDSKLVALGNTGFIPVWDVTSSDPHLIETFHGFTSLAKPVFVSPSFLISVAEDNSIKFWQIGSLSTDLAETDPGSTSLISAGGYLLTLQAKDGITITKEKDMLKVWDILTGLCKASFQNPDRGPSLQWLQLIDGRFIFVWNWMERIELWDIEEWKLLWTVDVDTWMEKIKMSQDGSMIYCLYSGSLWALATKTGKVIGQVGIRFGSGHSYYLSVDDFGVWVHYSKSEHEGWNFGISGASPVKLLDVSPYQCCINSTLQWDPSLRGIKNKVTGKVVFWVSKSYGDIFDVQWNDLCLVICFKSKEVSVLDFTHIL